MYIKNNKDPKIDPCGMPAFTLVHDETYLSKALDMSKNTPLTSKPLSKEVKIS